MALNNETSRLEEMTVQLEATLTQSSFGYEYAVLNLKKEVPFAQRQLLLDQMEAHKKVYFRAREMLGRISPDKLTRVEQDIIRQKTAVLKDCDLVNSQEENHPVYPVTLH